MDRRRFIGLVITLPAAPLAARAQPARKIRRIGLMAPAVTQSPARDEVWPELRELGWIEGQNLIVERRRAKPERLPSLAAELVQIKVELILTFGSDATIAAKNATTSIPIVMIVGDPVALGVVPGLAHPGGNITGYSLATPEVVRKRAALLHELLPAARRIGILVNPKTPSSNFWRHESEQAYRALGVEPVFVEVTEAKALDDAVAEVVRRRGQALDFVFDGLFSENQGTVVNAALRYALPVSAPVREMLELGGVISYEPDQVELQGRVSTMIDKILRGAKPASLPIEQPTKFRLLINLKTAKALGITIPQALLLRADEVIK